MQLTTSLFALTALVSSYQIYNVEKRIQEDTLQFLAAFLDHAKGYKNSSIETEELQEAPFQHLNFLIRDWQNFRSDSSEETKDREMEDYMIKVFEGKEHAELNVTRAQIRECFQKISCQGLCHPGLRVSSLNYEGDLKDIDEEFLRLFTHYIHHHLLANAPSKVILGRKLLANDFIRYFKTYTNIFSNRSGLPRAQTILEAMASVHNITSFQTVVDKYKSDLTRDLWDANTSALMY
jgi:atlastin